MNYIRHVLFCIIYLTSIQAFSYDSTDSFEVAENKLLNTDCSVSQNDCRYYAAIEYVSFAKACLIVLEYQLKSRVNKEEINQINLWIENWKAIEEPQIHSAVLSKSNPFKEKLTKEAFVYLMTSPVEEINIECTRLVEIRQNKTPEEGSDLITKTKNYQKWLETNRNKKQQEFNQN